MIEPRSCRKNISAIDSGATLINQYNPSTSIGQHTRFSSTSTKAEQNPSSQETSIRMCACRPNSTDQVNGIADQIYWASSILVDKRHPDHIASTLEEGCRCEKVGHFRDSRDQTNLLPIWKEILSRLNHFT